MIVGTAADEVAARPRSATIAVARAVAAPEAALAMITPLVAPGGVAAAFVGAGAVIPPDAEEWEEGIAIVRL